MVSRDKAEPQSSEANVLYSLFWDVYVALVYGVLYVSLSITTP